MFIEVVVGIVAVITSLGIIIWLVNRKNDRSPNRTSQGANPAADQDENNDELDDVRAAEVVAIWTLLNPPS